MGERRTSTRKKSFLRGRVMYNNRQSAMDCLIRDVSEHGANLIFSDTASIPEVVELYIPQKDQTFRAHVQWRSGDEVGRGVRRCARGTRRRRRRSGRRVERLEAEVASLRRMLRRLKADIAAGNEPEAA